MSYPLPTPLSSGCWLLPAALRGMGVADRAALGVQHPHPALPLQALLLPALPLPPQIQRR